MFIIEFIIKKFKKNKQEDLYFEVEDENILLEKEYENCEHLFMPIDSTNEVLACAKCGLVKKREELKGKNFFKKGISE